MGKEERREISRQREGKVSAPGHSGSRAPPLPTAEKWKLLPGREAMSSGASAPCGAQGAAPPSSAPGSRAARRSLLHSRTEPGPRPPGGGGRRPGRGPCHPGDAPRPPPGPLASAAAARPLPAPPHTSNPAVGLSLASPGPASALLLRRRHSSSRRRRHRVLHPRRSHMEQPSQPRRSREPGSAAPRADGAPHARPLPDGVAPRASPTRQNPAGTSARRSAPSTPSPAFLLRHHHHYLPRRTSHTNPTHRGSTAAVRSAAVGQPRACPAHLGGNPLIGGAFPLACLGVHHRGSTPRLWRCFFPQPERRTPI